MLIHSADIVLSLDITRYPDLVKSNIQTLQDLRNANNKANNLKKHNDVFRSQVDGKIEEAKCFIEKQIVPEIDNINQEIDNKIDLLLKETLKLQEQAKQEKNELIKKREELVEILPLKGLFNSFKMISQVMNFLGPIRNIVCSATGVVTSISESLVLDKQTKPIEITLNAIPNFQLMGEELQTFKTIK
ncbi:uncharacterized protein CDAR_526641 [Caerostris darwini]|uniref:Uncharacterized protein n=1 Tax=Caerostris darwini TaxID=1538125 RepID=A0AAV4Q6Q5_9ARAC|nr:uncharacterized protein CDAR_526641 [Caerostris darwini]